MAAYGCLTNMHVVRLLAPDLDHADESKDIDFSREGIAARWRAGLEDARRMIAQAPWEKPVDPLAGFHLHEMNPERGIL
jgi:NTE family protein